MLCGWVLGWLVVACGTMACGRGFVDPGRGVVELAKCCERDEGLWSMAGLQKCCEAQKRGCRNLKPV